MRSIKFERFDNLLKFLPKSKIKAGDGQENGKYPFFTSSATLSKYIDTFNYENESLIFGSGGKESIHYCNEKFATSTDCFVVNNNSQNVDIKYIYYYLKSNIKLLEDGFKGAGLKHISKKYISQIKIPLLPLEEQQKIAQQLSQIEELINKREKSLKLLDELTKSTFLDMFGDPVLNPKKLEKEKLKKFGKIITGNTPPRAENKFYDSDFIEWVKTDNLFEDELFATQAKECLSEEGLKVGRKVKAGSLLVTCIAGSVKSIGTACLANRDVSFNQQINAIEPYENIDSYFLYQLFKVAKLYVQNQAGKGMKKMINKSTFENILFPMPDKDLQKKFGVIFQNIYKLKTTYQNSLNELNNLFGSIAQKAFKGELDVSKIELIQKDAITMTHHNAEDRLMSKEKEFICKMDKIIDNKSETELTIDDEGKAVALSLGYKFGFYDDESIEIMNSKGFLDRCNDEAEALNAMHKKHSNPNILIDGIINLILEKEQSLRVRYASSEILANYNDLNDETIDKLIDVIYNEKEIEEEIRLHTAYAFTGKIDVYSKIYNAIYWILRKQSTSVLSNKEIFIHFLEKEFKEKKESLAFDALIKNIAYDSRRMMAYKMFLFELLNYDVTNETLDTYDYKALKDDVFSFLKEKKIIQKFNTTTYEMNLFWNFDELETK